MPVELDIEEQKFDALLQDKRHRELVDKLGKVILKLSSDNGNSGIANAIQSNTEIIKGLISKVTDIKFDVQSPSVNVETNQEGVIGEIKALNESVGKLSELLEKQNEILEEMCRPKDYEFSFKRNQWGTLESPIKASVKKMKYGQLQ